MSEVKRSTEHSLELEGIIIKIDKPDGDTIEIQTVKDVRKYPVYGNYLQLRVIDMSTLRVALQDFQTWLDSQPKTEETK